jgi:hypothetical protein
MRMTATALALTLVACADASHEDKGLEGRLARASQGLCDARAHASRSDVARAAGVFNAEVHAFLHELAADLQETDRAAAAGLLEAKQRVEAALVEPARANPEEVATLLADLERALAAAAEAAGLAGTTCRKDAA